MRNKLTFAISIIALMAGLAMATPSIMSEAPGNYSFQSIDRDLVELWCQPPSEVDTNIYGAQFAYDYPFDAWVADDFFSDAGLVVDHAVFWGGCFYDPYVEFIEGVQVWIWDEAGQCVPGDPPNGTQIYLEVITEFTMTTDDGRTFMCEFDMPAFTPVAGQTYWIAFQPILNFTNYGQCGVKASSVAYGCTPMQHFEAAGLLVWTPVSTSDGDIAFCLYNGTTTATESSDWGAVKALY